MTLVRPIIVGTFTVLLSFTLYQYVVFSVPQYRTKMTNFSSYQDPFSVDQQPFQPKRSDLTLVVLRNSQVEPDGFTLALFNDKTIVDAQGRTHKLDPHQYHALLDLSEKVARLPKTGNFRNQWRVGHSATGFPIERILVPKLTLSDKPAEEYETEFDETSVYGYSKEKRILESPVGSFKELPDELWQLTGMVLEWRKEGENRDQVMLDRVRGIIGNLS